MIYVDYPERERRKAYRVSPGQYTPIRLAINGIAVPVLDISAEGIAFKTEDAENPFVDPDTPLPALLFLGSENHPIPVSLVLVATVKEQFRCRLIHFDLQGQKRLSQFIVAHQKQAIRMMRKAELDAADGQAETD